MISYNYIKGTKKIGDQKTNKRMGVKKKNGEVISNFSASYPEPGSNRHGSESTGV